MDNKKKSGHFEKCLKEFKVCGILTLAYIAVCWLFLYVLYRNRIFLKV